MEKTKLFQNQAEEIVSSNGSKNMDHPLKDLLSYIETTDLESVQIEKNGVKLSLKRSPHTIVERTPPVEKAEPEAPKLFIIRSPIVGKFYSSSGPDRPPFAVEGGRVSAGQRVAIVEAMKIKKEVFSASSGKVVRLFVRDGDPVEYGQELFSIQPQTEGEAE